MRRKWHKRLLPALLLRPAGQGGFGAYASVHTGRKGAEGVGGGEDPKLALPPPAARVNRHCLLGGRTAAADGAFLRRMGVTHVLNCTPEHEVKGGGWCGMRV